MIGLFLLLSCGETHEDDTRSSKDDKQLLAYPIQIPDSQVVKFQQKTISSITKEYHFSNDLLNMDIFRQTEIKPPMIDILIVVDNSGSMEEEQNNLSTKLKALISDLSDIDWQINVITTTSECMRIPKLPIKPDTPNMSVVFEEAVRAGTGGSAAEKGLEFSFKNISNPCAGEEWRRENADMAVLLVTDEDEDSGSVYANSSDKYISDIKIQGYSPNDDFKVYGIIGHESKPCADVFAYATTITEVIDKTDGLWGDICAADYSETLRAIAKDIRKNLKFILPLTYSPFLPTVELFIDDLPYDGSWTVIGSDLILNEALPEDATLTVEYQTVSSRILSVKDPDMQYQIESVYSDKSELLDPSTYIFDRENARVILSFDPEIDSTITINLIEQKILETRYKFPLYSVETIRCFVDSIEFISSYSVSKHYIKFDPAIPPGKEAICLYK